MTLTISHDKLWDAYRHIQTDFDSQNYQNALLIANAILERFPYEIEAVRSKSYALIQLEKFAECLKWLDSSSEDNRVTGPIDTQNLIFEKAYVYYRLNDYRESLQLLDDADNREDKVIHLRAQIGQRRGDERTWGIYEKLWLNEEKNPSLELCTNMISSRIVPLLFGSSMVNDLDYKRFPEKCKKSYDWLYNCGTFYVNMNDWMRAEDCLNDAEECYRKESGIGRDDMDLELLPIVVQKSLVLFKRGSLQMAKNTLDSVMERVDEVDEWLSLIMGYNKVLFEDGGDEVIREILIKQLLPKWKVMSPIQRESILINLAVLDVDNDLVLDVEGGIKNDKSMNAWFLMIKRFLNGRNPKDANFVLNELKPFYNSEKQGGHYGIISLLMAQMELRFGSPQEAMRILLLMEEDLYWKGKPVICIGLSQVYENLGLIEKSIEILNHLLSLAPTIDDQCQVLEKMAQISIRFLRWLEARSFLEQIIALKPYDLTIKSRLILVLLRIDPSAISHVELPPIDDLIGSIQVNILESNPAPNCPSSKLSNPPTMSPRPKKRRRKNKPARNQRPSGPDPERWIPLHLRKHIKRHQKESASGFGHQGSLHNRLMGSKLSKAPPPPSSRHSKRTGRK